MIVAEGSGMVSAGNTCFSNSLARAALFVFLIVPSPLHGYSAHGNCPSWWERTSLIRRWRLSTTRTIWVNIFMSACRITLFELLGEVFVRISEYGVTLFCVILSRNWAFVHSSSTRSRLNSSYAAMPNVFASRMPPVTSGGARVPAERLTQIVRSVIVQKLNKGVNVSFIPSDEQVWVTEMTHSTSHHFFWAASGTMSCCGTQKWGNASSQQPVSG